MFCKTCLILAIQNMSRNAYAQFPPHRDIFPPHAIPPYGGGRFPPMWKGLDKTLCYTIFVGFPLKKYKQYYTGNNM